MNSNADDFTSAVIVKNRWNNYENNSKMELTKGEVRDLVWNVYRHRSIKLDMIESDGNVAVGKAFLNKLITISKLF